MLLTVLFDLDDTLLLTNMDRFMPAYFEILGQALSHLGSQEKITEQIHHAVEKMVSNQNPELTLKEVFDSHFYAPLGTTEEACKQRLHNFYDQEYPQLKPITQTKRAAPKLIEWCQSQGMRIAIATNPLFPQAATRHRITWAGLDPTDFAFFTTYDDFHFTKPHLAYYAEVLGRLGWPETPIVMIGDSLTYDLFPMNDMGYQTYWVNQEDTSVKWVGGALSQVKPWLKQVLQNDKSLPSDHPEVNIAILRSTPAVIDTWLRQIPDRSREQQPPKQDLNSMKVFSGLADQENMVFQPLWHQLINNPKMPLPSLNDLTNQGSFLDNLQTLQQAFNRFLQARQISLEIIDNLYQNSAFNISPDQQQENMATIGGILGFIAKNDRRILQKLINLLNIYKIY